MLSAALLSGPLSADVAAELLRVEVLMPGLRRPALHSNTSTRRSIFPPPPLLPVLMQFSEGPVLPALRRFRGRKNLSGGRMPPPK
jgi:hypothetical protein